VPVNLSIKNVPDALARKLRERAEANGRSLQREMLAIIEAVTDERRDPPRAGATLRPPGERLSIEQVYDAARARFPAGTPSSVDFIRAQRDAGLSVDLDDRPAPRRRR
jgi:plasmid stability protein